MIPRSVALLTLLSLLLAFAGCGPSRPATFPVKGKVVFENNEPCQLGTIEFRSLDHMVTARGIIEKDGSFMLTTWEPGDGAVAGSHQIIIQQLIITEDLSFKSHNHGKRVPPRYGDYATSGIKATVKDQPLNELVITLDSRLK
jgi:hypothetical protein